MSKWAQKYDKCLICGTSEIRHIAKGLCLTCYSRQLNINNRGTASITRGAAKALITKEYLESEYVEKQRSLGDIAKDCSCSRPYVLQRIQHFGIETRSKTAARDVALRKGKLKIEQISNSGEKTFKTLDKISVNEGFFSEWSPRTAYVLGVIFTDGHKEVDESIYLNRKYEVFRRYYEQINR